MFCRRRCSVRRFIVSILLWREYAWNKFVSGEPEQSSSEHYQRKRHMEKTDRNKSRDSHCEMDCALQCSAADLHDGFHHDGPNNRLTSRKTSGHLRNVPIRCIDV